MKKKNSCGIALARCDPAGKLEIVMIQKRYTFQFFNFVMGCYKNEGTFLIEMLSHMTSEEKLAIFRLDFETMWYILWLSKPSKYVNNVFTKRYLAKKDIFEKNFSANNGAKIKKLIDLSNNSDTQWEIPKGRREKKETHVDTAVREFSEETGIREKDYTILLNEAPIIEAFTDGNVSYLNRYFLAIPGINDIRPKLRFSSKTQPLEVRAIRWIKRDHIDLMVISKEHKFRLRGLFREVNKKLKHAGYLRSSFDRPNQKAIVEDNKLMYIPSPQDSES